MKRKQFSVEQIVAIVKQATMGNRRTVLATGKTTSRRLRVAPPTLRSASCANRVRELKRVLAEKTLEVDCFKSAFLDVPPIAPQLLGWTLPVAVDVFEDVKAPGFNKHLQLSTIEPQLVQQQSTRINLLA